MLEKALEKLTKELEAETNPHRKYFATSVIKHLKERCQEDEGFCADVLQEHKTWVRCHEYLTRKAQKVLENQSGLIDDPTVFEWAEDYYRMDDKAEAERQNKLEQEKKKAKQKKSKAEKGQKASGKAKATKAKPNTSEPLEGVSAQMQGPEEAPVKEKDKPKHKKGETDGQISIFDILGGGE